MDQQQTIFELASSLCSNQDVDSLLVQLSDAVEKLTQSEAASILLLDDSKTRLTFKAATGAKGLSMKRFYVPVGQGVAGWVAKEGQPLIIDDVQSDERFTSKIDKSSGFSTRSILAIPLFNQGNLLGVMEALNKKEGKFTEQDKRTLENLGAFAGVIINNAKMSEDYRNFFSHTFEIITMAVEGSDSRLTGHSYRVAEMACRIGRELGIEGDDYRHLYYGALLHDLGMVAVNDLRYLPKVATKTMERTPEKLHPLVGSELVKDINLLKAVAPIIRHHHEFYDGSGHPDGLVGDDIPLAARIICLVEHLDELYMNGATGDEFNQQSAKLAEEGSGTKFDPRIVQHYLRIINQAAA